MPKGESLYHKYPGYQVALEPNTARVEVRAGATLVADSTSTLVVRETKHEPVLYFPREDVRFDLLDATDHHTFCPFKGEASYWTVRDAERQLENAIWSYEDPFPEAAGLKDYVAFYGDRFDIEVRETEEG